MFLGAWDLQAFSRPHYKRYANFVSKVYPVIEQESGLDLARNPPSIYFKCFPKVGRNPQYGSYELGCHTIFLDPNRRSYNQILYSLVHECVHADQFNRGYFKDNKWKGGVDVKTTINELRNFTDYLQLPWELDVAQRAPLIYVNLASRLLYCQK